MMMIMFSLSSPAYPVGVRYAANEYKSHIAVDSTLLLSALGVYRLSIIHFVSLERATSGSSAPVALSDKRKTCRS